MKIRSFFLTLLNNIESYICRTLLIVFVSLLMVQIISREVFGYSYSWIEELSTYLFVWFAYFGASHAAKMAAHNRVTFQFKAFPKIVQTVCETIADTIWLSFNIYFIYLSYDFVFHKMNLFWKSQTLGVPMKYFYAVLPVAFACMSIRVIQVNYLKLVKGVDIRDPDSCELESIADTMLDKDSTETAASKANS